MEIKCNRPSQQQNISIILVVGQLLSTAVITAPQLCGAPTTHAPTVATEALKSMQLRSQIEAGGEAWQISQMHALYTHLQYTTQHLVCTHITMCGAVNKQLRINKSVNTLYSPPDKNTYTSDSDIYATIPKPLSTPEICSPKACSL